MKFKGYAVAVAVLTATSLALTACASNESGSSSTASSSKSATSYFGTLSGIGSTAQTQAQTAWAARFQGANPNVTVNYSSQGSGAGVSGFTSGGTYGYAGSDAALSTDQLSQTFANCAAGSKPIDLPVYISPIAVAYHITGVTGLKLDANTLAGIFKGSIATWNDPAIGALNSGTVLPSAKITVIHRSDKSGTTFNFTDYLAQAAPSVWTHAASEVFPYQGESASGTPGVVQTLKNTDYSIAYADDSGATGLQKAQLKVGSSFATLSAKGSATVVAASKPASGRAANDLALSIDRTNTSSGAWPLVLVSYLIVCDHYKDPAMAKLVKGYATYVASSAGQTAAAKQAGSAPLSSGLSMKVQNIISSIR